MDPEIAQLKRMKFDRSSEQLSAEQRALFDEAVDGDIAAIDEQLATLQATLPPKPEEENKRPKRTPLPERLPRRDVHHEPEDTTCGCGQALKRIGEDVTESWTTRLACSQSSAMSAASGAARAAAPWCRLRSRRR
jgi:transposase